MPSTPARFLPKTFSPRVAVIGAGISGLACARHLVAAGMHPQVFERSRTPGGRCSTRFTAVGPFDHGAQDLAAFHPALVEQVQYWHEQGVVADWLARVVHLDRDGSVRPVSGARHVGVPGAASLCDEMARGVELEVDCPVRGLVRDGAGLWFVQTLTEHGDAMRGPYDVAIVAVASNQAAPLLAEAPLLRAHADSVDSLPVWTMLVSMATPVDVPFDVAMPDDPCIAWMARDSCKPGRPAGERWVVHAGPDWSLAHVDENPDHVRATMLAAFIRLTRAPVMPAFVAMHRWRYAVAMNPIDPSHLWDEELRIGACGDWMARAYTMPGGPGSIESAFQSGRELGIRVTRALFGRDA